MTKKQTHIILAALGVLFLALTFFREEWFTGSDLGLWTYRLLAIGGLLLFTGFLGRLFSSKWMWAFLIFLWMGEIGLSTLFRMAVNGRVFPEKITQFLSYIYLFHCRDYIIYDNHRGRYNENVFYTLKPGEFTYSNMEFSNRYQVNKQGFRDDENSLNDPKIIFLGDSYTMGWGVEQGESFAAVLEKELNKRVLNTGIASYGTAREYLTFEKINHDSCQLVILQFCPNDVRENRSFVQDNFHLNISPKEKFDQEIIWNKIYQVYFPLKYMHSTVHFFIKKIIPNKNDENEKELNVGEKLSKQALSDFFIILQKIKNSFNGEIIIFNLGMNITQPAINKQFENYLNENNIAGVHVFHSTDYLNKEDYLPLDTHLTKKGNKNIADGLKEFILKNNLIKQ